MNSIRIIEGINSSALAEIPEVAWPIIQYILDRESDQKGCILCVADQITGAPLLTIMFGMLPHDEIMECSGYVTEKAIRLAGREQDLSSAQSRDRDNKKYGGAIRGRIWIYSVSGFKEEQDEAVALILALSLKDIDSEVAAQIGRQSENNYFRRLQNVFHLPA